VVRLLGPLSRSSSAVALPSTVKRGPFSLGFFFLRPLHQKKKKKKKKGQGVRNTKFFKEALKLVVA
jgi:hypothetical protein